MNIRFLQLSLVAAATILLPVVSFRQESLPVSLPPTGDGSVCPANLDREMARDAIRSSAQEQLQAIKFSLPQCGDGRWYRVGFLNMTDPTMNCPDGWTEFLESEYVANGIRSCGRPVPTNPTGIGGSCASTVYRVNNGSEYSQVCGRIIGYHFNSPDGFPGSGEIDDIYLDGVSITRGYPRSHVWSFAAGAQCPCASQRFPPSFVGDDYFCETASYPYIEDPLWDGEGCQLDCDCTFNSPPWFSVAVSEATSDDIEVRICGNEGIDNEDTPIELLELYIQ